MELHQYHLFHLLCGQRQSLQRRTARGQALGQVFVAKLTRSSPVASQVVELVKLS